MRGNRTTLFLAAIGVLGVILAFVFFTYDDPPGLLLLGAASIALVLAFTHTWRETKKFVTLLFVSVGGMVSLGFLAHVFDALAEVSAHVVPVSRALGFLAVMSFSVAVFLGWAGILVGAVGALLLRVVEKTRSRA
jgi:hypothetical protein